MHLRFKLYYDQICFSSSIQLKSGQSVFLLRVSSRSALIIMPPSVEGKIEFFMVVLFKSGLGDTTLSDLQYDPFLILSHFEVMSFGVTTESDLKTPHQDALLCTNCIPFF